MQLVKIHIRTAGLALLLLATSACQTAQRPVSLLPPGSAPSLVAAAPAKSTSGGVSSSQPSSQVNPQEATRTDAADAQSVQKPDATESKAPASSDGTSDPVGELIAKVEKEYQTGLSNYESGKTDAAKQNFDSALNALLGSNLDIRSDDRLQKEFDRVVEGVNKLYPGGPGADSDGQADAQTDAQQDQQKSEPAPIDETNGLAPAADASTVAKAEAELKHTHSDLPLMMTDQVAGFISYFSGRGRGVFERALVRSGRYHDMIVATLKDEGVPQDLIYLAQAESGFHPLAVSRVGARGIWQFMASRGRGYGLSHSMYVDDRQDPEKSTRAAARHLKDLYNQFGDWYLAMAAYNSGPGTVQAAVKRTGYADFWELYRRNVLPKETRNYVPIIVAMTIVSKNLSQYGFDDVSMEAPAKFDTVTIDYPVDLRLVAECVNSTAAELQDLNPSLLRLTTPHEGKFDLRLPAGGKGEYLAAINSIPADKRLWWRYHTVQSGDTLASLARNYHTTAKLISETNNLDGTALEADARLVIPVTPGKHPLNDTATYARRITRYKIHRGDTVESVAENFGVSPLMLRRWNGIRKGNGLSGRKVLALHLPISPGAHDTEVASTHSKSKRSVTGSGAKTETATVKPPATKSAQIERLQAKNDEPPAVVRHKVKTGETLYSIANTYRTTVAALKRDNRNVAILHPGMILLVQPAR